MSSQNRNVVSPCHGVAMWVSTRSEGRQYLQYEVPDEFNCSAEGCYNTWDAETGIADPYNKYPDDEV